MKNLLRVIVEPGKVFEEDQKPWAPLIATVLIAICYFVVIQVVLKEEIFSMSLQYIEGLPEAQREAATAALQSRTRMVTALFTIILLIPLKVLIQALIYNVSVPLLGGEITYFKSLTVLSFANFISILSDVAKLPIAIFTRNPVPRTDLGILVGNSKSYLATVLSQVDPFTIWSLFIIALGLEKYGKMKKSNAAILVAILWIVYIFGIFPQLMVRGNV